MAQLIVVQGDQIGHRFELTIDSTVLGREASCQVCIRDSEISRRHLEIKRVGNQFKLIDLGSSNGTLVNGMAIRETWLRRGDRIQIGKTVMLFQIDPVIKTTESDLDGVRIVPPDTGEDKSAIIQALPALTSDV